MAGAQWSKSEARISKSETNENDQIETFEFRISDLFRISIFGFRVFGTYLEDLKNDSSYRCSRGKVGDGMYGKKNGRVVKFDRYGKRITKGGR